LLVEPAEDILDTLDAEQGLDWFVKGRYWPDLVAVDTSGRVVFWGECGKTALEKILMLAKDLPGVTLAVSKWGVQLPGFVAMTAKQLKKLSSERRVNFYSFPRNSLDEYFRDDGTIFVPSDDSAIDYIQLCGLEKDTDKEKNERQRPKINPDPATTDDSVSRRGTGPPRARASRKGQTGRRRLPGRARAKARAAAVSAD
jgi:hypothetical protein